MNRQFWKSNTFQFWFLGCLCILLLPLIAGTVYYGNVQENLETKSHEMSQVIIEQAANVIDEKFNMLCNVGDSTYVSSELKRIKYLSLPYDAETYYELHKRASYLSNFAMQYNLFQYIYVYYSDMHCLMDAQRIYTDMNQITSIIQNRIHMQEEGFIELTAQSNYNRFYMQEDGTILFLRTLSTRGSEKRPIISLVAVMNTSSIQEVLEQTAQNANGSAYLLSPDGTAFGVFGADDPMDYNAIAQSTRETPLGGDKRVTVHAHSAMSEVLYVLTIPNDVFLLDVTRTRQWFIISTCFSLVLGLFFCYGLTVRNYRPLHALKQRVSIADKEKDDFVLINAKLSELLAEENNLQHEIEHLGVISKKRAYHLLLTDRYSELEQSQKNTLCFDGDIFVVAWLCQGEGEQELFTDKSINASSDAVLNTLLSDLCAGNCEYALQKENNGFAAIFCFAACTDFIDAQLAVQSICMRLQERMIAHFDLSTIRIYIGDAHKGLQKVYLSYENAFRAKEYAEFILGGSKPIVLFDSTMYSADVSWRNYDIMDAERNFINLMLEGSYANAEQLLHEIMSYYSSTDGMSLYVMRCRMFGVMNMMLNILHEIEPDLAAEDYEGLSPVEMLLDARTPSELEKVVFSIIGQLVGAQESKTVDSKPRVEQIKRYIAANYYDVNLSVQMIADAYAMSLPYLSRIFKKEYGTGLLDYINHYRVEKAKEIMQTGSEETIASIATKVGFNSSQTLIRAFKRYEKVTPGKYKVSISDETLLNQ